MERISLDSILKDPHKFYREVVIPTLIKQFEIPKKYLPVINSIKVKIDPEAPSSSYDPNRGTITINPRSIKTLEHAIRVFGEEATHALAHKILGVQNPYMHEYFGYIGRYALADGLGVELKNTIIELNNDNIYKKLPGSDIEIFDPNMSKIAEIYAKVNKLELDAYKLLLLYAKNVVNENIVDRFFNQLDRFISNIRSSINELKSIGNMLAKKYKSVEPSTIEAVYYYSLKEAVDDRKRNLELLLQYLEPLVKIPNENEIREEVYMQFGSWIEECKKSNTREECDKLMDILHEVVTLSYPRLLYDMIKRIKKSGDTNLLNDTINSIKNYLRAKIENRREIDSENDLPIIDINVSIGDYIEYIVNIHNIGYMVGSRVVEDIRKGKLTYKEAFWRYNEIFNRYLNIILN